MSRAVWIFCLAGVAAAGALAWWSHRSGQQREASTREVTELLEQLLARRQYDRVVTTVERLLEEDPRQPDIAYVGALAALENKRPELGLRWTRVAQGPPRTGKADEASLLSLEGLALFHLGRPSEAEAVYRRALAHAPDHRTTRQRLSLLLQIGGRGSETWSWSLENLKTNHFTLNDLISLALHREWLPANDYVQRVLQRNPDEPFALLAEAHRAFAEQDLDAAEANLRRVLAIDAKAVGAWVLLGKVMAKRGDTASLGAWLRRSPPEPDRYPGVWIVRGLYCEGTGDWRGAVRCFAEVVRRDGTDVEALIHLSRCLMACGAKQEAEALEPTVRALEELVSRVRSVQSGPGNADWIVRIAALCRELGRYWEADGWAQWYLQRPPATLENVNVANPEAEIEHDRKARRWFKQLRAFVSTRLSPDLPQVVSHRDPGRVVTPEDWPLPSWNQAEEKALAWRPADLARQPRFRDVAREKGIAFTFFNSDDPKTQGRRIFDSTGGGVAALDFDQDGWPDLYFTQDAPWPVDPNQQTYLDRLYHNQGGHRFVDVTHASGLGDNRYSQGVSAGDFNGDGWPDLLVANIGTNRLYVNNGDGTFTDVTKAAGLEGDAWTTSCMICDVDGDGHADLYEVNYLQGETVFTWICKRGMVAGICSPHEFESAQDRLWLSRGDGTFYDATRETGIGLSGGKGLGIVAGRLVNNKDFAIFVANDTTPNYLFVRAAASPDPPRFEDQATARGVAYGASGKAQGCMGIAVDDSNGDGLSDLFVTNFYRELNAFYVQNQGVFLDRASVWELGRASFLSVGFGTAFLDAENDGLPDLVVANGHIDDYGGQEPLEMQPQFFRNLGNRFALWPASRLGGYFEEKFLGRGLAVLDFNRDGREDFAVSNIGTAAALVENQAENPGHFIVLRFTARHGARDAYGAIVTVETDDGWRRVRQLIAGGGYEATHERQLVVGLGGHRHIRKLTIEWPDGSQETFENLPVDLHVHIVQAHGWWPEPAPSSRFSSSRAADRDDEPIRRTGRSG